MTRAEEKAIDAWAIYEYREHPKGLYHTCFVDGYKEGYEQAEKDLALTPDDIKLITKIHYEIVFKDTTGIKVGDVASEVLKRYKEAKK
jgi:hypothetical protein